MEWFTSDLHFGHKKMLEYRPFKTIEEHDEALVRAWQAQVTPRDTVYVLGDFSFRRAAETSALLKRLPGHKCLIKGNHDHRQDLKKIEGWAWIKDYYELKVEKQKLVLFHFPLLTWNRAHQGSWHLHGHSHGNLVPMPGKRLDVGVDCHAFRPISLETVRELMARREFAVVDHHVEKGLTDS